MLGSRVDVTDVRLPRFPVFLPMASCPRRCVYCHQGEITGEGGVPPASVKESLARLETPGARVHVTDEIVIETPTLQDTLTRVLAWAGDEPLGSLNARVASLEQVFLAVADRPLTNA